MSFVVTSCSFKVHRVSGSGRGKPSAIVHIGFLAFHGISLKHTRVRKIAILLFKGCVVWKVLVSLIGRLIARIAADR